MKSLNKTNQKGFTIIEVLIVLAIAGVIMAIVFLAIPSLQRNSRNTQRRSDVSHMAGLVSEYASNNTGSLPAGLTGGISSAACSSSCLDITNEKFSIMSSASVNTSATANYGNTKSMVVNEGWTCSQNTLTQTGAGSTDFAIGYQVETSSGTANACVSG